jgi:hypothetical protein
MADNDALPGQEEFRRTLMEMETHVYNTLYPLVAARIQAAVKVDPESWPTVLAEMLAELHAAPLIGEGQDPAKALLTSLSPLGHTVIDAVATPRPTGRPRRSGYYQNGAELYRDLSPIVQALRKEGLRPTAETVAKRLPTKTTAKQLSRWVRQFFHLSWDGFLKYV